MNRPVTPPVEEVGWQIDVADGIGRRPYKWRVGGELAAAVPLARDDDRAGDARLPRDDRALMDDDEFAVQVLLQLDAAARVAAPVRAGRDLHQSLLESHRVVVGDRPHVVQATDAVEVEPARDAAMRIDRFGR